MRRCLWWLTAWSLCLLLPLSAMASSARNSYFRATRLYKQKRWLLAKAEFEKTIALVKKLPSRTKKQRLFVNLGLSDIRYHLVRIQLAQNQKSAACQQLSGLVASIDMIKKKWPRWRRQRINLLLPGRFRDAKKRFRQCKDVPASITLTALPPGAKIYLEQPDDTGKAIWKKIDATFRTKATSAKIKIEAPGYLPQTRVLTLSRWVPQSYPFSLKKKPKPRVRPRKRLPDRVVVVRPPVRPRLPPPVPVYKKGWFWAVVGGGVAIAAGGIIAGVVIANQPKTITPVPPGGVIKFPQ